MFFGLLAVDDHLCCKMQEVVETFFLNSIEQEVFSMTLFPDWIKKTLEKKTCGLSLSFEKVHTLLCGVGMTQADRKAIYDQFHSTNSIEKLCDGVANINPSVIVWDSDLGKAIDALMLSLYDSLDLAIFKKEGFEKKPTHQFYDEFIEKNSYVCPFCGLNKFKNRKGDRREDFDHYLNKSAYPLAAANMKNLVPTCGTCNQDYKKAKDILANGKAFYPYTVIPEVKVEIICQAYPEPGDFQDKGDWIVNLELVVPNDELTPKLAAWNRVYSIKQRLEYEVKEFFEEWMNEVSDGHPPAVDGQGFLGLIASAKAKATARSQRRMQPGQIIRVAFYDFMLRQATGTFVESFRQLLNHRCL